MDMVRNYLAGLNFSMHERVDPLASKFSALFTAASSPQCFRSKFLGVNDLPAVERDLP
jgi:hypothetical protein